MDLALHKLISQAPPQVTELSALAPRLLLQPEQFPAPPAGADLERFRNFLEALGAAHGLPLMLEDAHLWAQTGRDLDGRALPSVPWTVPLAWRDDVRRLMREGASGRASYETVQYRPTAGVARLPGQWAYAELDDGQRRDYSLLVVAGLDQWQDSALHVTYARSSDPLSRILPSPLLAFLQLAAWVPQSRPGNRREVDLVPAAQAWWVDEIETPDFLPAEPPLHRRLASARALQRLRDVGARSGRTPPARATGCRSSQTWWLLGRLRRAPSWPSPCAHRSSKRGETCSRSARPRPLNS